MCFLNSDMSCEISDYSVYKGSLFNGVSDDQVFGEVILKVNDVLYDVFCDDFEIKLLIFCIQVDICGKLDELFG